MATSATGIPSSVTDMDGAFNDRSAFNENISTWDLSNVTNTMHMFKGATSFNQPIGDWNTLPSWLWLGMFNQLVILLISSIGNWNTSTVTDDWIYVSRCFFIQPIN